MRNGILYHKSEVNHPDRSTMQLVLPEAYRKQALQGCQDDLGHLGIEWTIDPLKGLFLLALECLLKQLNISNNVKDV